MGLVWYGARTIGGAGARVYGQLGEAGARVYGQLGGAGARVYG